MSENAERPARSGRGSGQKERPTASSVRSRPRIGSEGAADRLERAFQAADRARRRPVENAHGKYARSRCSFSYLYNFTTRARKRII